MKMRRNALLDSPLHRAVIAEDLHLHYGKETALQGVCLQLNAGDTLALIGPDGVGKSSLIALVAGVRAMQAGRLVVLGSDMQWPSHREQACNRIAYMPQGLGRNLYPTLSVEENLQFFGRLFGHDAPARRSRIDRLTRSVGLNEFLDRPVAALSGGMKQKTALCCALIHDPDLLVLDEPTTGVDPLARAQFWELLDGVRQQRPHMSMLVATAYMDEAKRFDRIAAMDDGAVLALGTPEELLARTRTQRLDEAYLALLPQSRTRGHRPFHIAPLRPKADDVAIEARGLTIRYGDFTAVDRVDLRIQRGEIFGFLGSNGCGKSSTMKMLAGLIPATAGKAWLFGNEVRSEDILTRRRIGHMSQAFSLYPELTVRQNLVLHAQLFHIPKTQIDERIHELLDRFGLNKVEHALPSALPLGIRQRLSIAAAIVHRPELLILDEPTSGVDPVARDQFWHYLIELSRRDGVTIFISTHFMNEAERCDRLSMMHAGRILGSGTPDSLRTEHKAGTLEDVFIKYLVEATGEAAPTPRDPSPTSKSCELPVDEGVSLESVRTATFSMQRLISYLWREALELRRDPVRATLALAGSVVLMVVISLGFSMDVDNLSMAVLDRDHSSQSEAYVRQFSSSRYFTLMPPLEDYADMDQRMRSGELALAIEIPPQFGRDLASGHPTSIGAWFDGAIPRRGDTIKAYAMGAHQHWIALRQPTPNHTQGTQSTVHMETRFHYNPNIRSIPAMVPSVIALLLLMLPAMLTALSVVREKAVGSIVNLYVTPVTRIEFLIGKQLPYVALAMLNFLLMCTVAVFGFGLQMSGSITLLAVAALLYSLVSTSMGLLASTITRSQIAAIFIAALGTLVPATQFAGLITPVSSLDGLARFIGETYPATHMITVSQGVFSKSLSLQDGFVMLIPLALASPLVLILATILLPRQER